MWLRCWTGHQKVIGSTLNPQSIGIVNVKVMSINKRIMKDREATTVAREDRYILQAEHVQAPGSLALKLRASCCCEHDRSVVGAVTA